MGSEMCIRDRAEITPACLECTSGAARRPAQLPARGALGLTQALRLKLSASLKLAPPGHDMYMEFQ